MKHTESTSRKATARRLETIVRSLDEIADELRDIRQAHPDWCDNGNEWLDPILGALLENYVRTDRLAGDVRRTAHMIKDERTIEQRRADYRAQQQARLADGSL